jgi:hypothetical protein
MPRYLPLVGTALAAVLCAGPARAWNKPGHMVTGAIAYAVLQQESPQTIPKVVALLKQHPYYERHWEEQVSQSSVPEADRDLYLFMLAARWADDARDDTRFYPHGLHLERIHYINLPYKPDGQPDWVKTAEPEDINIFRGYEDNLARLKGGDGGPDRAVALCWVMHLIGDVHQPLHTASLFTTRFQKEQGQLIGDRGGTRFYIRARDGSAPIDLHYFWDGLILGRDRFRDVNNRAVELRKRDEFARAKLSELEVTDFEKWALAESFPRAKEVAYLNGNLDGSPQKALAPVLPADYAAKAQAVAERRAVLAGYRLADVLKKALP